MTTPAAFAVDEVSLSSPVTYTYECDAYGNSFTVSGTTPNEMLYRGEQFDPDLGLYYLRARYYNPLTGRFMSRDPNEGNIKIPVTLHKYLYAVGNPANAIDPTGRNALDELALIGDVITQVTVPAIVEAVGEYVELEVIPFTLDAAEAVAEFAKDAGEVIESNGIMKWYVCSQLGDLFADAVVDVVNSDAPEDEKKADSVTLSGDLEKACGIFIFHEPPTP